MIDITTALQNILKAIYGKDVRQSIHDAIYQINENANEAIDLAQIKFGTDVTEPTSPTGDYIEGTVYFNIQTGIIWRLSGGSWNELGTMKTIDEIRKSSTVGLEDTYEIVYNDGTTSEYKVTNGVSISDIRKVSTSANVDHYEINLSNGATTPNGFDVTNGLDGVSVTDVQLDSQVGATKNYKMLLSNGTTTPNSFSVNDGTSSYVYIRYSSNFDGQGMVSVPTDQTVYIGICVTTQSSAPTDPSVYSWVRFIGKSGSGAGDMLKADYSTKYNNVVDKAAALFDGVEEIEANQLLKKSEYNTNGNTGIVDKSAKVVDLTNGKEASSEVLANFTDDGSGLKYKGNDIGQKITLDNNTIVNDASGSIKVADKIANTPQMISDVFGSKSTNYVAGDYCIKDNKLYKANGTTSRTSWVAANWDEVSITDEISNVNDNLSSYLITQDYEVPVEFNNEQYKNQSYTPPTKTNYECIGVISYSVPSSYMYVNRLTTSQVQLRREGNTSVSATVKVALTLLYRRII